MDNDPISIFGVLLAIIFAPLLIPLFLIGVWLVALLVGVLHVVAWICAIVDRRARDAAGTAGGL